MNLLAPASYLKATDAERAKICNGTGAAGTPKCLVWFLDSFLGLGINLSPASQPHDWMYHYGKRWYHKIWADIVYFLNMFLICFLAIFQLPLSRFIGNLIMFPVRIVVRVVPYFLAVLFFGWKAFYDSGKKPFKQKLRVSIFK